MSVRYSPPRIGILAIHGSVEEHAIALNKLNFNSVEIRTPDDFANLAGLILPGGESTTLTSLITKFNIKTELKKFIQSDKPVFGTCAGLILLAQFGFLDVEVKRNAYGRQLSSFEEDLKIPILGKKKFPGVFIRAPRIVSVGKNIDILAQLNKVPVFVRQKNIFAASFHPELTIDLRIHQLIFCKDN